MFLLKQWFMTMDLNLNPEPPICAVTLRRIASSFGLVRPEKGMTKVLFNTMFRWCPRTSWKCIARDLLWTNPFKLIAEDVYDKYRTICCVFMHNIVLSLPQMPIWREKKGGTICMSLDVFIITLGQVLHSKDSSTYQALYVFVPHGVLDRLVWRSPDK